MTIDRSSAAARKAAQDHTDARRYGGAWRKRRARKAARLASKAAERAAKSRA